ncbi:MAG: hypothetical protein M1814_006452 [Vezdaea aestivalis]|nr:MAG: hypothetical protein M1814_006452 [Vezdaea aestivalis]
MGSGEPDIPYLQELYIPPDGPPSIDIVFVHGLNVNDESNFARNTWTEDDCFWPKDLLADDFPEARILLYGYNANVSADVSEARIKEHADTLLWKLLYKRKWNRRTLQTKIIFVGHNLGGIVVKTALLNARDNSQYKRILDCTWGLVFFACPHKGADGQAFGDVVARVAEYVSMGRADNDLLHGLQRNSFFTDDTIERFSQQLLRYRIVSFIEMQPMYLGGVGDDTRSGVVVSRSSAILGLPGGTETKIPLNKNHVDVCRVSGRNEMYADIQAAFEMLIDGALEHFHPGNIFVEEEHPQHRMRSKSQSRLPSSGSTKISSQKPTPISAEGPDAGRELSRELDSEPKKEVEQAQGVESSSDSKQEPKQKQKHERKSGSSLWRRSRLEAEQKNKAAQFDQLLSDQLMLTEHLGASSGFSVPKSKSYIDLKTTALQKEAVEQPPFHKEGQRALSDPKAPLPTVTAQVPQITLGSGSIPTLDDIVANKTRKSGQKHDRARSTDSKPKVAGTYEPVVFGSFGVPSSSGLPSSNEPNPESNAEARHKKAHAAARRGAFSHKLKNGLAEGQLKPEMSTTTPKISIPFTLSDVFDKPADPAIASPLEANHGSTAFAFGQVGLPQKSVTDAQTTSQGPKPGESKPPTKTFNHARYIPVDLTIPPAKTKAQKVPPENVKESTEELQHTLSIPQINPKIHISISKDSDHKVRATHSFGSEHIVASLSFAAGDIIKVSELYSDGWGMGTLNGKRGLFPQHYTERVYVYALALYDFLPEQPTDLGFKTGDHIFVVQEGEPEKWWKGSLNGATGQFPSNYCKILPPCPLSEYQARIKNQPNAKSLTSPTKAAGAPNYAGVNPPKLLKMSATFRCASGHAHRAGQSIIQCKICVYIFHCLECGAEYSRGDKKDHMSHQMDDELWAHHKHFFIENNGQSSPYTLIPATLRLGRMLKDWHNNQVIKVPNSNIMDFETHREGSLRLVVGAIPAGTWHVSFQMQYAPAVSLTPALFSRLSFTKRAWLKIGTSWVGEVGVRCVGVTDRSQFLSRTGGTQVPLKWALVMPTMVGKSTACVLKPAYDPIELGPGIELGVQFDYNLNQSSFIKEPREFQNALGIRWRLEGIRFQKFAVPKSHQAPTACAIRLR